jgi:DNA-binding IclR family transcriptional regulator
MSALPDAVAILRCFSAEENALSHGALVSKTRLPKSTVSRLLGLMKDEGLLSYEAETRSYRPGVLLFQLGQLYRARNGLLNLIERELTRFAETIGHTAYIAVRDGTEQIVLRTVPGKNPLRVINAVGERSPIHATSNGRALLARLSTAEIRKIFPGALPAVSPNVPRSLDELLPRLARIRHNGISEASNETLAGVASLGIAIVDPETQESYGIAVSFSSLATPPDEIAHIRRAVLEIGQKVGAGVGDAFWTGLPAEREVG